MANDWLAEEYRTEAVQTYARAHGTNRGHEQVRAVYEQAHEAWAREHLRALHVVLLRAPGPPPAVTVGLFDEGGSPLQTGEWVTLDDGSHALRLTVLVDGGAGPAAILRHEMDLAIRDYHQFPDDREKYRPIVVGLHAALSRHVPDLPPPGRLVQASGKEQLRQARERMR